ncbi:MAG: hypothetical protein Q4G63_00030 [Bacteroidia bacterium]|nr:hypothetical protein [Bacteroidia bacterium]
MPNFTHQSSSSGKLNVKTPSCLSIHIILLYAKSLRVEKKLPIPLNSFIIN